MPGPKPKTKNCGKGPRNSRKERSVGEMPSSSASRASGKGFSVFCFGLWKVGMVGERELAWL